MARSARDETLLLVSRAIMGISTHAADRLDTVSVVQLRALTVLRQLGTANLGRLADELDVTVSTTSRLVDRLVSAGLVERRTSPRTRREIELRVAPDGNEVLTRYDELRLEELRGALRRIPAEGRDAVVRALDEFGAAATAHRAALLEAR